MKRVVSGFRFRASVSGFEFRVLGFGLQVLGFGLRVSGFGLRVSGFGFRVSSSVRSHFVALRAVCDLMWKHL